MPASSSAARCPDTHVRASIVTRRSSDRGDVSNVRRRRPEPRASREHIEGFVSRHAEFRHASEVLPIMLCDAPDESRIASQHIALNDNLRSTYRLRAKGASTREPVYSPDLLHDLRDLSAQFDAARGAIAPVVITLPSALTDLISSCSTTSASRAGRRRWTSGYSPNGTVAG